MKEVGFSLGSNIGDKVGHLTRALELLFGDGEIEFLACSSFYRTAPWGHEDQDWFVNACAVGRTALTPDQLLARCKQIETEIGRRRTFRWGPRVIDIDILFLGTDEIAEPDLAIPHKELFNRGFVLIPLAEIRPDLVLSRKRVGEEAGRFDAEEMEVIRESWSPD